MWRFISGLKNSKPLRPFDLTWYMARSAWRSKVSISSPSPGNMPMPIEALSCRRVGAADIGQHHHELVAAMAADGIDAAHAAHQPLRRLAQQQVAHVVAQRVVDVLETVEVDEQHGHHAVVTARRRQRLVQPIEQQHAVGQVGQHVVLGQVAGAGLEPAARGHAVHQRQVDCQLLALACGDLAHDRVQQAPVIVGNGREQHVDPEFAAVAPQAAPVEPHVDLLVGARGQPDKRRRRQHAAHLLQRGKVSQAVAEHERRRRAPEHAQRARIDVDETLAVDERECVAGVLVHRLWPHGTYLSKVARAAVHHCCATSAATIDLPQSRFIPDFSIPAMFLRDPSHTNGPDHGNFLQCHAVPPCGRSRADTFTARTPEKCHDDCLPAHHVPAHGPLAPVAQACRAAAPAAPAAPADRVDRRRPGLPAARGAGAAHDAGRAGCGPGAGRAGRCQAGHSGTGQRRRCRHCHPFTGAQLALIRLAGALLFRHHQVQGFGRGAGHHRAGRHDGGRRPGAGAHRPVRLAGAPATAAGAARRGAGKAGHGRQKRAQQPGAAGATIHFAKRLRCHPEQRGAGARQRQVGTGHGADRPHRAGRRRDPRADGGRGQPAPRAGRREAGARHAGRALPRGRLPATHVRRHGGAHQSRHRGRFARAAGLHCRAQRRRRTARRHVRQGRHRHRPRGRGARGADDGAARRRRPAGGVPGDRRQGRGAAGHAGPAQRRRRLCAGDGGPGARRPGDRLEAAEFKTGHARAPARVCDGGTIGPLDQGLSHVDHQNQHPEPGLCHHGHGGARRTGHVFVPRVGHGSDAQCGNSRRHDRGELPGRFARGRGKRHHPSHRGRGQHRQRHQDPARQFVGRPRCRVRGVRAGHQYGQGHAGHPRQGGHRAPALPARSQGPVHRALRGREQPSRGADRPDGYRPLAARPVHHGRPGDRQTLPGRGRRGTGTPERPGRAPDPGQPAAPRHDGAGHRRRRSDHCDCRHQHQPAGRLHQPGRGRTAGGHRGRRRPGRDVDLAPERPARRDPRFDQGAGRQRGGRGPAHPESGSRPAPHAARRHHAHGAQRRIGQGAGPARQRETHHRRGRRADHGDRVLLPALVALDHHHGADAADIGPGQLYRHEVLRLHAQHADPDGAVAVHRPADRRRHRGHHRPFLPAVRHHGGGGRAGVAVRQFYARPDAVVRVARPGAGARAGVAQAHAGDGAGPVCGQPAAGAANRRRNDARAGRRLGQPADENPGGLEPAIHGQQGAAGGSGAEAIPGHRARDCGGGHAGRPQHGADRHEAARPRAAPAAVEKRHGAPHPRAAGQHRRHHPVGGHEADLYCHPGHRRGQAGPGGPSVDGQDARDPWRGGPRIQPGRRQSVHQHQDRQRARQRPRADGAADRRRAAPVRGGRHHQPLPGGRWPELRSQCATAQVGPPAGGRPGRPVAGLQQAGHGRPSADDPAAPGGGIRAGLQSAGAQAPGAAAPGGDLRQHRGPPGRRHRPRRPARHRQHRVAGRRALRRGRQCAGNAGEYDVSHGCAGDCRDLHLPGAGVAVRQFPAAGGHHDVAAAVADRGAGGAAGDGQHAQHLFGDRLHHADGAGDQECDPAGGLHQPGAKGRHGTVRGDPERGPGTAASHRDDDAGDGVRHVADGDRHGGRRRNAGPDGPRRDRRGDHVHHPDAGGGAGGIHLPG
uniref:Uncharacterized protein n=1 Tax=Tanacetum cinerariifolium TaxID=118510 RepID=A0A699GFZ5_TANCI|nr:hypothetical protein [Tanacetum cinerariifolium]